MTTTTRTNDDDLLAKIAEFKREEALAPEFNQPEADGKRLRAMADDIADTVPVTLSGVLALLEFEDFESESAALAAVTGLRAIMGVRDADSPKALARTGLTVRGDDALSPSLTLELALDDIDQLEKVLYELGEKREDGAALIYLARQLSDHQKKAFDAFELLASQGGAK
jgi:hypothetical protein